MSIVISILGFSFLVFIHELGHFLFARLTGMKVEKFSIGFGPALYQFGTDTVYQIALFPFGGFVQIKGLTPEPEPQKRAPAPPQDLAALEREWGGGQVFAPVEEFDDALSQTQEASGDGERSPEDDLLAETEEERLQREAEALEGSFMSKSLWARFLVVSAGPIFNALFTLLVFGGMFAAQSAFNFQGSQSPSMVINEVNGAAAQAGLLSGDVLLSVNDEPIKEFHTLRHLTINSKGQPLKITVARPPQADMRSYSAHNLHQECVEGFKKYRSDIKAQRIKPKRALTDAEVNTYCAPREGLLLYRGTSAKDWPQRTFTITPENKAPEGATPLYRLGIAPERDRFGGQGLWGNTRLAWGEVSHLIQMMSSKIYGALKGEDTVEVASVVKITAISADTVKRGNEWFLQFLAFLSLNLAFLNLLPFPALDGGRLIFLGIEALTRRPVPPRLEMMVHAMGILMLLVLTVWVTAKDIFSLL